MKKCSKCQTEKRPGEFYKDKSKKDGLSSYCRPCRLENSKKNTNLEAHREVSRRYYQRNKAKVNGYVKAYKNKKYQEDIDFRMSCVLRSQLRRVLSRQGRPNGEQWHELLGTTMDGFREHIEGLFVDGMTWGNHGDWHLDHIKPCAAFDLSKEEDRRACFNYRNLQPLWAVDNMKKGASYEGS